MLVWAWEGISSSAKTVIEKAGHRVDTGPGIALRDAGDYPFVMWTRLEPVCGGWNPRLVATPCTDSSHCDEARKAGIKVLSLRDVPPQEMQSVRATVEMTIGLILALTRRIPSAVESVRRGEWDRMKWQGTDLHKKVVAVVGFGRIGTVVGRILIEFGATVIPIDPSSEGDVDDTSWASSVTELFKPSNLLSTLPEMDLVTVHADLNPTSRGMFGPAEFAAMKPGAYFVNTSRGQVVQEPALLAALESGHLAGAAMDVLCDEPPSADSPLLAFARREPSRLLISPHLAGCSVESLELAETLLARKLVEVLADGG